MTFELLRSGAPADLNGGARVRNLVVNLKGVTAVAGMNADFGAEVVAIAGANGAGKSTLLRVLATLCPPTGGTVEVGGHDYRDRRGQARARRLLGYLPQEPDFPRSFTVRELVEYGAWLKRVEGKRRRESVSRAVAALDLLDVADKKIGRLSGGTRRRAFLAQAIVHDPSVLLLDEPSSGLDPEHRLELRTYLRRIANGRLVVLTTHLVEDVEMLADRVLVLSRGQVGFDGPPAGLAALAGDGDSRSSALERALRAVGAGIAAERPSC